jgi:uncharacterized membrane protein
VALADVRTLFETGSRHWDVALRWNPNELAIDVSDCADGRSGTR